MQESRTTGGWGENEALKLKDRSYRHGCSMIPKLEFEASEVKQS